LRLQLSGKYKEGDCLVVWKLDRLGRSLLNLINIVEELKIKKVGFKSITEKMDTTTPHGEFLFSVFGALAQYERALTKERVIAGLSAAKKRGRVGGRPKTISAEQMQAIVDAINSGASKAAICRTFNVKRTTLYDALGRSAEAAPCI
jgi:DNA invertase Pin-like site-specific DNA recombinase